MTRPPMPSDYDREDGLSDDTLLEQCPHCERTYSGNGGYLGPVYDDRGREFTTYLDTDPKQGPFYCEECWPELLRNRKQSKNHSLGDFA